MGGSSRSRGGEEQGLSRQQMDNIFSQFTEIQSQYQANSGQQTRLLRQQGAETRRQSQLARVASRNTVRSENLRLRSVATQQRTEARQNLLDQVAGTEQRRGLEIMGQNQVNESRSNLAKAVRGNAAATQNSLTALFRRR